jgi:hypothetical protein
VEVVDLFQQAMRARTEILRIAREPALRSKRSLCHGKRRLRMR